MVGNSTQSPRYDFEPIIYRKPVRFPKGERLALLIYVNIEHVPFGSTALAHAVYPGTLQFSPDILNHGWRDYGNRVGLWRIMDAMDKHGLRGTVNLNSDVCREYPQIIQEGNARRWEWGAQGDNNMSIPALMQEEQERGFIQRNLRIIEEATGTRPKGWLSMCLAESFSTPDLLAEAGIEYVSNYTHDELPVPMAGEVWLAADNALHAGDQRRAGNHGQGCFGGRFRPDDSRSVRCAVRRGSKASPHHVDIGAPVHLGAPFPHEAHRGGAWICGRTCRCVAGHRRGNQQLVSRQLPGSWPCRLERLTGRGRRPGGTDVKEGDS